LISFNSFHTQSQAAGTHAAITMDTIGLSTPAAAPKVIPAQLSFLSIFNPSLSSTEETFEDQIVYYYSRDVHARRKKQDNQENTQQLQDEEHEKQRQIGLAQGMVNFARYVATSTYIICRALIALKEFCQRLGS
jgi:First Longin domain of INTU, CCZ1 and HPS4